MGDAQSNSKLIAAYLDAVIHKDASVVNRYFHPNVEYMVNGTSVPDPTGVLPPISTDCHTALPRLGIYHGREGLKGFLGHMHRNLEVTAFGPREVISEGDKAAAFGWFRLRALPAGRTADISYSIRFELRRPDHQVSLPGEHIRCRSRVSRRRLVVDGYGRRKAQCAIGTRNFGDTQCPLRAR
jgi:ketosteroid isomerase-like protein